MRLIMIRHGASIHSGRSIIASGAACLGLTEEGFRQAHRLAERLRAEPVDYLLSSPALRAYQTAEVIARVMGNRTIIRDDDLTEVRTGKAEGMSWDTYRSQYGAFDLPAEPTRPFAPGGENWLEFTGRVRVTLQRLADMYKNQTVIAVTHAGFIVASMLVVFNIPSMQADREPSMRGWLNPAYTSITEWSVTPEAWTLVHYNDVTHLA